MRHPRVFFLFLLMFASTITLAQSSVEGQVKNASGSPLSGAQVSLTRTGATTAAQKVATDAEGRFHFAAVEGGQYTVSTGATGFFTSSYQLVLRPREPVSLAIQLTPKTAIEQNVEVKAEYQTIDPGKTGSSQTF